MIIVLTEAKGKQILEIAMLKYPLLHLPLTWCKWSPEAFMQALPHIRLPSNFKLFWFEYENRVSSDSKAIKVTFVINLAWWSFSHCVVVMILPPSFTAIALETNYLWGVLSYSKPWITMCCLIFLLLFLRKSVQNKEAGGLSQQTSLNWLSP